MNHPVNVDWSTGRIELVTSAQDWPDSGRPRRATVSAFGLSGTNAQVILEQAPEAPEGERRPVTGLADSAVPLVFSGKSAEALRAQATRLADYVEEGAPDLESLAHGLIGSRTLFDHRAVVVGAERGELVAGLRGLHQSAGRVSSRPALCVSRKHT